MTGWYELSSFTIYNTVDMEVKISLVLYIMYCVQRLDKAYNKMHHSTNENNII